MSRMGADVRWDVPSADALRKLAAASLPLGLQATNPERTVFRDVYYDTPDISLRARGVACRVRHRADGIRELAVSIVSDQGSAPNVRRAQVELPDGDIHSLLEGTSEPARMLRSITNASTLDAQLELEIDRYARTASAPSFWRRARFALEYDVVTVRAAGLARSFHEVAVRVAKRGNPSLEQFSTAMRDEFGLRTLTFERYERGEQLRAALESESLARGIGSGRWVVLAALDGPHVATRRNGSSLLLPSAEGNGEEACRHLMRSALGNTVGELRLLTTASSQGRLQSLEVWVCMKVDRSAQPGNVTPIAWMPIEEMLARIGSPEISDAATLAALSALANWELLPQLASLPTAEGLEAITQERSLSPAKTKRRSDGPVLDAEASLLAFNLRVLELAEDETVPLLERLRYLAIFSSNLDEFFSVQVGALKYEGRDGTEDGDESRPAELRVGAAARYARTLIARQEACAAVCLRALAPHGIRVRAIGDVTPDEGEYLRQYFRSTILPYLTPRAITATPGHSLPIVGDRSLCFAVALREGEGGSGGLHLAELAVPTALPRFLQLPGTGDFVPLEDVIRQALPRVYPGRRVESAHLFRVTRFADLGIEESRSGNLAQSVHEHVQRRKHQPVVRIEVERGMSPPIRTLLLRELQLEPGARPNALTLADVYEIDGLLDLDALRLLADQPIPALAYPPARPRRILADEPSLWPTIRQRDVLLHHPYDEFATSVVRFFNEAADDPDVASIKVTLYRAGERSPIVDALRRAAKAGKDVTAFVELKARFDEERNVRWTTELEAAGVHVVQGLPGYKNHSKVALVLRREENGVRRYVHIGTGNYNAGTARVYTDLGMFTAREAICDDATDLFNTLTGSSAPAKVPYRECLVAPHALLEGLLERIEREAKHAREGRQGRIRIKVNGLSEDEVVQALYRAAKDGVQIDLIVRGICTLSPVSERIRVVSVLGRFLEHARIYVFRNGGDSEYFIGSADLRPRNLRRRVEVLAPVHPPELRARLDEIMDVEIADPTAWTLLLDGTYVRRSLAQRTHVGASAQAHFIAGTTHRERVVE